MPLHPLYREIGTELSQQVFEARRLRGELGAEALDSTHRRLYRVSGAELRSFIADPDLGNVDGMTVSDDVEQVRLSKRRRGRG